MGRILDSVLIWESTGQQQPVLFHISTLYLQLGLDVFKRMLPGTPFAQGMEETPVKKVLGILFHCTKNEVFH